MRDKLDIQFLQYAVRPGNPLWCSFLSFFFSKLKKSYFWWCWVLAAVCRLSLVAVRGGYSGCGARASHCNGCSYCRTKNQTCVPHTGRQILNHWTTRKAPLSCCFVLGSKRARISLIFWESLNSSSLDTLYPWLFFYTRILKNTLHRSLTVK